MWKELAEEIAKVWYEDRFIICAVPGVDRFIICAVTGVLMLMFLCIVAVIASYPSILFIFVIFPGIAWFIGYLTIRFLMWINNVSIPKKD